MRCLKMDKTVQCMTEPGNGNGKGSRLMRSFGLPSEGLRCSQGEQEGSDSSLQEGEGRTLTDGWPLLWTGTYHICA